MERKVKSKESKTNTLKKVPVRRKKITKDSNPNENSLKKESNVNREEKKPIDKRIKILIPILVILVIAIAVAFFVFKHDSVTNAEIEKVNTINEMKNRLNVNVIEPNGSENTKYSIEDDTVAVIEYEKDVMSGGKMKFVLRTSSSLEENLSKLNERWGTPILMTVICDDNSDVGVTSYVSIDDNAIMKADWYDNDKYYSMTTDNLITREDFLQEVNSIVIENHIEF